MNINSLRLHFYTKESNIHSISIQRSPTNPLICTHINLLPCELLFFHKTQLTPSLYFLFSCFLPDLFCRHLLCVHCGHNVEMDVYLRFPGIAAHLLGSSLPNGTAKGFQIGLIATRGPLQCIDWKAPTKRQYDKTTVLITQTSKTCDSLNLRLH